MQEFAFVLASFPCSYVKRALLCVSYPVSVPVCTSEFLCLGVFDRLSVYAGVQACHTLLSSPVWVVDDDSSGHCRLVVLLVCGERRSNGRNGDAVSPAYHHIDTGHCVGACPRVCACMYFAMTACQPTL